MILNLLPHKSPLALAVPSRHAGRFTPRAGGSPSLYLSTRATP